jgi:CheY-like chemotaxis protein
MNNAQILVVDDDKEDHMILLDFFTEVGLQDKIYFVDNGQRAIEFLETANDAELPKLIVLDLNMPVLNGTQTLIQMKQRARLKNIPVIIYSTSENETERRKCLSFGAIDYLVKPLTFEDGKKIVSKFSSFIVP